MNKRSGPFWDAIEGRAPRPRAAVTLGLEFIDADIVNGTIEARVCRDGGFHQPDGQRARSLRGRDALRHGRASPSRNPRARTVSVHPGTQCELPAAGSAGTTRRQGACRSPRRRHGVPRGVAARFPGDAHRHCHCYRSGHPPGPSSVRGLTAPEGTSRSRSRLGRPLRRRVG
jgi:hypothetical protein